MKKNQMFIVCNEFVGVRHCLHHLIRIQINVCLCDSRTKIEHFMHDDSLIRQSPYFLYHFLHFQFIFFKCVSLLVWLG
jgi:hypothetical protein